MEAQKNPSATGAKKRPRRRGRGKLSFLPRLFLLSTGLSSHPELNDHFGAGKGPKGEKGPNPPLGSQKETREDQR